MPSPEAEREELLRQTLGQLLGELADIRARVISVFPAADASPDKVREALMTIRGLQDRVEELVSRTLSVHAGLARITAEAKDTYEQAWAEEARKGNRASVRQGADMQGPRERYAEYDLATLQQRRAMRQNEALLGLAAEALEQARLRHRGIDNTRQDLIAVLRALAFETALERS
jgi:hypothetical protein